jgi:hypothetical protein
MIKKHYIRFFFVFSVLSGLIPLILPNFVSAADLSQFRAGRIIEDGVFSNKGTMTPTDIQNFLNSKMTSCDTWGTKLSEYGGGTRAQYGAARGNPAPFTCLKDYYQNPATGQDNYGGQPIPSGAISAAQIIWNYSQQFNINAQVILVTLQKENGMITDEWPFIKQYREAMGFGCPDNVAPGAPACDPSYGSFSGQVYEAARHFRNYMDRQYCDANWCTPYRVGERYIAYDTDPACGGTVVNIENRATSALYSYTPYQPNPAALAAGYGLAEPCGAFGNRNFFSYFTDWFGSTKTSTPYAWQYVSQQAYQDAQRSVRFTSTPTVLPGGKVYVTVKAMNVGYQTWQNSVVRIAPSKPIDTPSVFAADTWMSNIRAVSLKEASVAPGQIGSFEFELQAPTTTGEYRSYFNILAENIVWFNDIGLRFTVNVNTPSQPSAQANPTLSTGQSLSTGRTLLSGDTQSVLTVDRNGNLVLLSNFKPAWSISGAGYKDNRLVMQGDGNLVLYNAAGTPLWNTETQGNPGAYLTIQTDGNLVLYTPSGVALWATYTIHTPEHLSYVNTTLPVGTLYPFQQLETPSRKYRLILQPDGNLVLYTQQGVPLWASGTDGKQVSFLAMQGDGHLVLYDKNYLPIWYSRTSGSAASNLALQEDGNLVLYTSDLRPIWATYTNPR